MVAAVRRMPLTIRVKLPATLIPLTASRMPSCIRLTSSTRGKSGTGSQPQQSKTLILAGHERPNAAQGQLRLDVAGQPLVQLGDLVDQRV